MMKRTTRSICIGFVLLFALLQLGVASAAPPVPYTTLAINLIGSETGAKAEIVAHDAVNQMLYVVNGTSSVRVLDISDPTDPTLASTINVGGSANSVAIDNGLVVVANGGGYVTFYDIGTATSVNLTVGAEPDMVIFTPDGATVLVANEGELNGDGSVSVIDVSGGFGSLSQAAVQSADFSAFNTRRVELQSRGVVIRNTAPDTVADDLEPEYIAVSADSSTAFINLQENNAFAILDIATATITDILPLGMKDFSRGLPELTAHPITNMPSMGVSADNQPITLAALSGLAYTGSAGSTLNFVTVPDFGPKPSARDVDNDGQSEQPLVLPNYQARIYQMAFDEVAGTFAFGGEILLKRSDGVTPITLNPNSVGDSAELTDLAGDPIPYDPFGLDMEEVVYDDTDGTYWIADEFGPSVAHFSANGTLIARYVPNGLGVASAAPAGTFGSETLPAHYLDARTNLGFTALALDSANDLLYAFVQSPMSTVGASSHILRVLAIDTGSGVAQAEYVYVLEKPAHRLGEVDKIDAAHFAGNGQFYVLERDSTSTVLGKKSVNLVDIRGATNILPLNISNLEANTIDQLEAAHNVVPLHKTKVVNLPSLGYSDGAPEGITLLPDGRMALINDTSYGSFSVPTPLDGTVTYTPPSINPTLAIIAFSQSNGLDASSADNSLNVQHYPAYALRQPDGISSFIANGLTYYITANEGDSTGHSSTSPAAISADSTLFPNAAIFGDMQIGSYRISQSLGQLDGDADYDRLIGFGARSFSIWDQYGNLVHDSGDDFAQILGSDQDPSRRGTRPEGITTGIEDGRTYAFVGLARSNGFVVYDVSDPTAPRFTVHKDGDGFISPEGLTFISRADSPTGQALLVVANESGVGGGVAIYSLVPQVPTAVEMATVGVDSAESNTLILLITLLSLLATLTVVSHHKHNN